MLRDSTGVVFDRRRDRRGRRRAGGATARIGVCLTALLLAASALGDEVWVSDAWIRLLPGDLPAAAYFVLRNDGNRPVTLTGAATADFASAELHRSTERGGLQTMARVESVAVAAHGALEFRPGAYHIMLMGRRHPVAVGDSVRITLRMADGSEIPADFVVRGPAARGAQ